MAGKNKVTIISKKHISKYNFFIITYYFLVGLLVVFLVWVFLVGLSLALGVSFFQNPRRSMSLFIFIGVLQVFHQLRNKK